MKKIILLIFTLFSIFTALNVKASLITQVNWELSSGAVFAADITLSDDWTYLEGATGTITGGIYNYNIAGSYFAEYGDFFDGFDYLVIDGLGHDILLDWDSQASFSANKFIFDDSPSFANYFDHDFGGSGIEDVINYHFNDIVKVSEPSTLSLLTFILLILGNSSRKIKMRFNMLS